MVAAPFETGSEGNRAVADDSIAYSLFLKRVSPATAGSI